ncbi:ATP-binding protein [Agathobacter ruminis]|uniref:Circadian input-output histidine kinase CikA n=1 Tax=Agathobacter ruminis TaxID=1712665 RepID=A0A2G3E283_9FIRM|nr:ATP-binding protein [Agathobacter ruminis]MDC7300578.1 ATP-binding protein [Agathobacter ruminis]PHU37213.1 hypothetical protein CSX02_09410 [Agathobacter ruminis]
MNIDYKLVFLGVMLAVEVALLVCTIVTFRKKGDLAISLRKVCVSIFLAMIAYALYVTSINEHHALIWMCLFSLGIDWILLMFMEYIISYTDSRFRGRVVLLLSYIGVIADSVSMACNIFYRHAFSVHLIHDTRYGIDAYQMQNSTVFYRAHLGFCYFLSAIVLIWLIQKMISTISFYRKKYILIILGFLLLLAADGISITIKTPFNLSIIFYGIVSVVLTYFSFSYIPRSLMNNVLKIVSRELNNMVTCFDQDGRLVYANKAAKNLVNKTHQLDWLSSIYREWRDRYSDNDSEEDGTYWEEEIMIEEKHTIFQFEAKRLFDDRQQYIGVYITAYDRTEEILKHQQELEEAQAKIARESRFWANISHEMRTPANAILGMNEMILRDETNEELRKYAEYIKVSTETLIMLINDVLDFSKINAKSMAILPKEYEILHMVKAIYAMALPKAQKKSLELKIELDPFLPKRLLGDELRLRQVIMNLISNAIKYTASGSVSLRLFGEQRFEDYYLHVEVEDTGIGIKKENIALLFQAYERIDEARVHGIQGTGLGLNICKQLLEQMESKLEVQSEYNKGSLFSFRVKQPKMSDEYIPDFKEYLNMQEAHELTYEIPEDAEGKILYVDDNEMNCEVFHALTKKTHFEIYDAHNGSEALKITKKHQFDLIFMDHLMPEMNGDEAFVMMRSDAENLNHDTPVIMLTANVGEDLREKFLNMGFADYLTKPLSPEKLAETFIDWM